VSFILSYPKIEGRILLLKAISLLVSMVARKNVISGVSSKTSSMKRKAVNKMFVPDELKVRKGKKVLDNRRTIFKMVELIHKRYVGRMGSNCACLL
jgi:hypothetical protein